MEESFDLQEAMSTFEFVFRLYNFVSRAQDDNGALKNPFNSVTNLDVAILGMGYSSLTSRKRKERDDDENDDGAGNGPPKKRQTDDGLAENDILSDVAIQKALRAGYTIPEEVEGFGSILPVRVSFP